MCVCVRACVCVCVRACVHVLYCMPVHVPIGYYVYIETSFPAQTGHTGILQSQQLNSTTCYVSFWYHMFGTTIGELRVAIKDPKAINTVSCARLCLVPSLLSLMTVSRLCCRMLSFPRVTICVYENSLNSRVSFHVVSVCTGLDKEGKSGRLVAPGDCPG